MKIYIFTHVMIPRYNKAFYKYADKPFIEKVFRDNVFNI